MALQTKYMKYKIMAKKMKECGAFHFFGQCQILITYVFYPFYKWFGPTIWVPISFLRFSLVTWKMSSILETFTNLTYIENKDLRFNNYISYFISGLSHF